MQYEYLCSLHSPQASGTAFAVIIQPLTRQSALPAAKRSRKPHRGARTRSAHLRAAAWVLQKEGPGSCPGSCKQAP